MPTFVCKTLDPSGRLETAEISVADRGELMRKLKEMSLSPLEVSEKLESPLDSTLSLFRRRSVSSKDISIFTAQLSALLNAKMTLAKALSSIVAQSPQGPMKGLASSLLDSLQRGGSLSDSLSAFPSQFPPLYVSMVKVGEASGSIDKALLRVVEMRERDEALAGKLKAALAYPAAMAAVMAASLLVMLGFVIPKFSSAFSQMGGSLPFPTRAVLAASSFIESWWWLLAIAVVAAAAAVRHAFKDKELRLRVDKASLSLPLLGELLRSVSLSRFSSSLGALLAGGVPMMKAMDAAIPVAGNLFVEAELKQVARELREGGSLSSSLRKRPEAFPSLLAGMAGTGEETGSLHEMLSGAGEWLRKDSERKIGALTVLLEPAMIVAMGCVVGFVVAAILLPIFNVSSSIR